jgi:hypothetical protein
MAGLVPAIHAAPLGVPNFTGVMPVTEYWIARLRGR